MFSYIPTVDSGQDRSEVKDQFSDDSKCVGEGRFDISYLRVVIRQDVKSHNFGRERERETFNKYSPVWHRCHTLCGRVCWLTIWIKTAFKFQGQLVGVIAANPGFVSALKEWRRKTTPKRWRDCVTLLEWKSGETLWLVLVSPAARMNWPSFDTLMEVHTVGISKSWMSSILRWMSKGGGGIKERSLNNDSYPEETIKPGCCRGQLTDIFLL